MKHVLDLPKVKTRKEFTEYLESLIQIPKECQNGESQGYEQELKAYVLEVDGDFASEYSDKEFGWSILDTGLDELKILCVTYRNDKYEFFLDVHDKRLPTLHTNVDSDIAEEIIKKLVEFCTLDTVWFHSDLLKKFSKDVGNTLIGFEMSYSNKAIKSLYGTDSDIVNLSINMNGLSGGLVNILDTDDIQRKATYVKVRVKRGQDDNPDMIQEDIDRNGCFTVKKGKSVDAHLQLVKMCRERYARIIYDIEGMHVGISESHGKQIFTGQAFELEFSKIENLNKFINNMFNSKSPFMLWGTKTKIQDGYFKVVAVDLHNSSIVDFEIANDMMRIYIYKQGCGNTIMRILTNLKIHHDTKTKCPQLDNIMNST